MSEPEPQQEAGAPTAAPPEKEKKEIFAAVSSSVAEAADASAAADAELIIVGAKNSGKSTLVQNFLQKEEPPKPSTPLEFRFARRANGNSTIVANVWELGGGVAGSTAAELLQQVLLPDQMAKSVVVITLDFAEPEGALESLTGWFSAVRARVEQMRTELAISAAGSAIAGAARQATEELWAEHADTGVEAVEAVNPVGVPVVVVAHKWDVFEQTYGETEYRKLVSRALRFLAHQAGASLICTKARDKTSMTVLRNLLYHLVFKTSAEAIGRSLQFEHSRPLVVAASSDCFAGIGKPPTVEGCLSDLQSDKWKAAYAAMFPSKQGSKQAQDLTMVESEQFAEAAIDELRRQKRDELAKMRQAAEFDAKMQDAQATTIST